MSAGLYEVIRREPDSVTALGAESVEFRRGMTILAMWHVVHRGLEARATQRRHYAGPSFQRTNASRA